MWLLVLEKLACLIMFRGDHDAHFLKVELDASGGSDYSLVSTTQMMRIMRLLKYAENSGLNAI